ncbi:MAG TPA: hypothetical protein VEU96_16875 [Bryobacteraceae bacterium]|nr:hypothetical protein [Bryobacteraceae bacterium]
MGCAALAFCWQFLTVHANYQGRWNALFCTAAGYPQPPQFVGENLYLFQNSPGYDGTVYHYIAHDPFLTGAMLPYVDAPRYRYRRILVPLAAYALAMGRTDWVDTAYFAVILLFVFLGGYWLAGLRPLWGIGFLLVPATLISLDRMTVDIALAALCAGFAVFVARGSAWQIYAVLVAAPLVRETGLLLIAAYVLHLLWKQKLRDAVLFATAVIPTLLWYLFVMVQTHPEGGGVFSLIPFEGFVTRLFTPTAYALSGKTAMLVTILDYGALVGMALAVALAIRMAWHRLTGPIEIATYLFALLTIFLVHPEPWRDPFGYSRALSPLLLFVALSGLPRGEWVSAAPLLLVALRVVAQFWPQVMGILHIAART